MMRTKLVGSKLILGLFAVSFCFSTALAQSDKVSNYLTSGVQPTTALGQKYLQFPLANYGVHTVVQKQIYGSETALLFYVIKMPNGYGKLYVTPSRLVYEPEGGINVKRFEIERSTIQSIVLQNNWQTVQNVPNLNVSYSKDKKQFGINRTVGSSEYAQIELSRYSFALSYLQLALEDFAGSLELFEGIFVASERTAKEAEDQRKAAVEAKEKFEQELKQKEEERKRLDEERFEKRLKLSDSFSEQRKVYDRDVQTAIQQRKPAGRILSSSLKQKVDLAIKALRRMSAASEVGVIFTEYSSRLIDTKATVDEATEALPKGILKSELELSIQAYVDGGRAWNTFNQDSRKYLTEVDDIYWVLIDRYPIRPSSIDSFPRTLEKQNVLSVLWRDGDNHLRNSAAYMGN